MDYKTNTNNKLSGKYESTVSDRIDSCVTALVKSIVAEVSQAGLYHVVVATNELAQFVYDELEIKLSKKKLSRIKCESIWDYFSSKNRRSIENTGKQPIALNEYISIIKALSSTMKLDVSFVWTLLNSNVHTDDQKIFTQTLNKVLSLKNMYVPISQIGTSNPASIDKVYLLLSLFYKSEIKLWIDKTIETGTDVAEYSINTEAIEVRNVLQNKLLRTYSDIDLEIASVLKAASRNNLSLLASNNNVTDRIEIQAWISGFDVRRNEARSIAFSQEMALISAVYTWWESMDPDALITCFKMLGVQNKVLFKVFGTRNIEEIRHQTISDPTLRAGNSISDTITVLAGIAWTRLDKKIDWPTIENIVVTLGNYDRNRSFVLWQASQHNPGLLAEIKCAVLEVVSGYHIPDHTIHLIDHDFSLLSPPTEDLWVLTDLQSDELNLDLLNILFTVYPGKISVSTLNTTENLKNVG